MALLTDSGRPGANRTTTTATTLGLIMALVLSVGRDLSAQAAPALEYQVKAVFLFNFTQFVDWPPQAFPEAKTPLIIGVLGEDPFGGYLDETVVGEKVNNRPLAVQRYRRIEEIETCHILFISRSEADRLEQILADLKDRNILTVDDAEGVTEHGVMIGLVTEKGKVRLKINLEAAQSADLTISSKLLRAAEIVDSGAD